MPLNLAIDSALSINEKQFEYLNKNTLNHIQNVMKRSAQFSSEDSNSNEDESRKKRDLANNEAQNVIKRSAQFSSEDSSSNEDESRKKRDVANTNTSLKPTTKAKPKKATKSAANMVDPAVNNTTDEGHHRGKHHKGSNSSQNSKSPKHNRKD